MTIHVSWALLGVLSLLALVGMQAAFAAAQARFVRSIDRLIDGMCASEMPPDRASVEPDRSL